MFLETCLLAFIGTGYSTFCGFVWLALATEFRLTMNIIITAGPTLASLLTMW